MTAAGEALRNEAVRQWLLDAYDQEGDAVRDWDKHGLVVLRCGQNFCAVRLPDSIVHAAANSADPLVVHSFLEIVLDGGPVFRDPSGRRYYALVPPDTARLWNAPDGTACLGPDWYLGVPRPDLTLDPLAETLPPGPSYWVVPCTRPGAVCRPSAIAELVTIARPRLTEDDDR